ncbi:MAG: hypothetical protein HC805_05945 [Alkalinema sp. RL_2_19]|nr:hypothetical protein [Alkalinema sp. RL_2_19]
MVREAQPLTRVVPINANPDIAATQPNSARQDRPSRGRKGRLVLEVQDPEAIANLGEQLSLANELMTPVVDEDEAIPTATRRKRSTTAKGSKTTASKTSATKTSRASKSTQTSSTSTSSTSKSTVSQAKQKK